MGWSRERDAAWGEERRARSWLDATSGYACNLRIALKNALAANTGDQYALAARLQVAERQVAQAREDWAGWRRICRSLA